jgi:hypothetical protein
MGAEAASINCKYQLFRNIIVVRPHRKRIEAAGASRAGKTAVEALADG